MKRVLLAAGLVALSSCPAAFAHGGQPGFTSQVTGVVPRTPGLEATVLQGDDRIGLRNETGKTIVVLGYAREPYLRFTPSAVFRDSHSPATYLNAVRSVTSMSQRRRIRRRRPSGSRSQMRATTSGMTIASTG